MEQPESGAPEMTSPRLTDDFPHPPSRPLLRFGLFGEFSSGKSSLANVLLGSEMLPTAVLASTRRPTIARFAQQLEIRAIREDGSRVELSHDTLDSLDRENISCIDIGLPSELLRSFELLDTAGFADPHHDTSQTLLVADEVDACVWCTLATQAWRESERKTWHSLPDHLRANSILVVTHIDNIVNGKDFRRLEARLQRETEGLFHTIVLLSAPDAMRARGPGDVIVDPVLWASSGGGPLLAAIRRAISQGTVRRIITEDEVSADREMISKVVDLLAAPAVAASTPASADVVSIAVPAAPEITSAAAAARQIDVHAFLLKVVAAVPSCLLAAWIDLDGGRVQNSVSASGNEAIEAAAGAAIADFLRGERLLRFEAGILDTSSTTAAADRGGLREIVVSGSDWQCLMLRSPRESDHALLIVSESKNLGPLLSIARNLINSTATEFGP
ncbi:dynamin family protein [Bradyrhizobium oligotrophicum]|uniref:dynamin family protein n=1 Tax=Bradyrhizobium oligotrophicum TaxID=44255 RepID=UPI003EC03598